MSLSKPVLFGCLLGLTALGAACSGGDDDGTDPARDGGTTSIRDAGVSRDSGVVDAGDDRDGGVDRDAGPPDSGAIDPESEPFRTRRSSGPSDNRVDIVIVGDGYTREELTTRFHQHVGDAIDRTFSSRNRQNAATEPFRTYRDYFNVHQVHLVSNESGIDGPGDPVDTALDGRAGPCTGLTSGCPLDFAKADAAIDAALAGTDITPDIKVVLLNTDTNEAGSYFPTEGPYVVLGGAYTNSDVTRSEMFMREIAVAWAGLAYETDDAPGGAFPGAAPLGANTSTTASGAWPEWDGYEAPNLNGDGRAALHPIGAFEGAGGYATGIYRPSRNSKLGTFIPGPFNAVAREAIIHRIYDDVSLIDSFLDNSSRLVNPASLWVVALDSGVQVEWSVNGDIVEEVQQTTFGPVAYAMQENLPAGLYTVVARVQDSTTMVRRDRERLESTITWEIELTE